MPVDNTPAFPINSDNYAHPDNAGMTLRDYFAAKAMPVFLANINSSFASDAKNAYEMADAMLKAREGGSA